MSKSSNTFFKVPDLSLAGKNLGPPKVELKIEYKNKLGLYQGNYNLKQADRPPSKSEKKRIKIVLKEKQIDRPKFEQQLKGVQIKGSRNLRESVSQGRLDQRKTSGTTHISLNTVSSREVATVKTITCVMRRKDPSRIVVVPNT